MWNEFLSKTEGFGFGPGGVPGRVTGVESIKTTSEKTTRALLAYYVTPILRD